MPQKKTMEKNMIFEYVYMHNNLYYSEWHFLRELFWDNHIFENKSGHPEQ